MSNNFKIAFIGSHGVGKTTLCFGLAARLKARDVSLEVVGEIARKCPLPINRGTTLSAQTWILHVQISEEVVASERYDVVICDRSVLDNFVYLLLAAGTQPALDSLITHWLHSYDLLIRVPVTNDPKADGLRSTDPAFQLAVQDRLESEIKSRCIDTLDLKGLPRSDWLDAVELEVHQRLRSPAQLELL